MGITTSTLIIIKLSNCERTGFSAAKTFSGLGSLFYYR